MNPRAKSLARKRVSRVTRAATCTVLCAIIANANASLDTCQLYWQPGNFQMTETFENSCSNIPNTGSSFYARGELEAYAFGLGRYVVSSTGIGLGYPISSLWNYAVLEFEGANYSLGASSGNYFYGNYKSWQVANGYTLLAGGPGVTFENHASFIKNGLLASTVDVRFSNAGTLYANGGVLNFTNTFNGANGTIQVADGALVTFSGPVSNLSGIAGKISFAPSTPLAGQANFQGATLVGGPLIATGTYASFAGTVDNQADLTIAGSLSLGNFNVNTLGGRIIGTGAGNIQGGTLKNATLEGTLTTSGTTLKDVTIKGAVIGKSDSRMSGVLTNTGTLTFSSGAYPQYIYLDGDTTLNGSGKTILSDGGTSFAGIAFPTLTVGPGHTVQGTGQLGMDRNAIKLVNQGTLRATGPSSLSVTAPDVGGVSNFDNSAGTVVIDDNAGFSLSVTTTLQGGRVKGTGNASISSGTLKGATLEGSLRNFGTTLRDVTINGTVNTVGTTHMSGVLTNNGTLSFNSGNSTQSIYLDSDTTLNGTGQTTLTGGGTNIWSATFPTLTIGTGHTLQGIGSLGNSGSIKLVNQGTLRATGPSSLSIVAPDLSGVSSFDNTAGTVVIDNNASLGLSVTTTLLGGHMVGNGSNATFSGGTIKGATLEGSLRNSGANLRDVTVNGALSATGTLRMSGALTNNGALSFNSGNSTQTVYIDGDTSLSGKGTTTLLGGGVSFLGTGASTPTLVIGAGQTLQGSGSIGVSGFPLKLLNQGTLLVGPGSMSNYSGNNAAVNEGRIAISSGSTLSILFQAGSIKQTTQTASIEVDGTLSLNSLELDAGRLSGTGRIVGNVLNVGGVIAPGHSPGKLSISGNLTLGQASELDIDLGGKTRGVDYDWLDVTGSITLNGTLHVSFAQAAQVGDSFDFLTASGSIDGAFSQVSANGYELSVNGTSHGLKLTVTGVTPVPELPTGSLMMGGLLAAAMYARRRPDPRVNA